MQAKKSHLNINKFANKIKNFYFSKKHKTFLRIMQFDLQAMLVTYQMYI